MTEGKINKMKGIEGRTNAHAGSKEVLTRNTYINTNLTRGFVPLFDEQWRDLVEQLGNTMVFPY